VTWRWVYGLILLNVALYAVGFSVPLADAWWQLVPYGFSHATWWHLALNMVGLLTLGLALERRKGGPWLAAFWFACLVGAGALQLALGDGRPVVGASGAVFGLLVAYAIHWPEKRVLLLVLPMTARALVYTYLTFEIIFAVTGYEPAVAHWCHIGGALTGAVIMFISRNRKPAKFV